METKDKIEGERPNQNITVVNKGLFYYIFFVLSLPFRAVFFVGKFLWKYGGIYWSWCMDCFEFNKKRKDLNKMLSRKNNHYDEEII